MAQSVERRIGSAEVTGSIPVTSLKKGTSQSKFLFFLLYSLFSGQLGPDSLQRIINCFFRLS